MTKKDTAYYYIEMNPNGFEVFLSTRELFNNQYSNLASLPIETANVLLDIIHMMHKKYPKPKLKEI